MDDQKRTYLVIIEFSPADHNDVSQNLLRNSEPTISCEVSRSPFPKNMSMEHVDDYIDTNTYFSDREQDSISTGHRASLTAGRNSARLYAVVYRKEAALKLDIFHTLLELLWCIDMR